MKISVVHIKDFLSVEDAVFSLADQGLTLIVGDNQDDPSAISNGAGKSTLIDAVCWSLWGRTAHGVSGDEVIRDAVGVKNASVNVSVEDGDFIYWVRRSRKKAKTQLILTQIETTTTVVSTDITLGTDKLTQDRIAKILGCTEEVFRASVYIGQEDLPDIPNMTDKTLKTLIEEAAGVTILQSAHDRAKVRHNAAISALSVHKTECSSLIRQIEAMKERVGIEEEYKGEYNASKKLQLSTIDTDISSDFAKLQVLSSTLKGASVEALKDELIEVRKGFVEHETAQDKSRRLAQDLKSCEIFLSRKQDRAASTQADLTRRITTCASSKSKIGTPCGECGTPLTEGHFHGVLESAQQRVVECELSLAIDNRDVLGAEYALQTAQDAYARQAAAMPPTPVALTQREGEIKAQLDVMGKTQTEFNAIKISMSTRVARRKELNETENPHEARVAKILQCVTELETAQAEAEEALVAADQKATNEGSAVSVFSPSGVRAHILDTVTPYLNDRSNAYLSVLSDDRIQVIWNTLSKTAKGEYRENFSVELRNLDQPRSFGSFSGGQKRKVRIACALALQDLVASRSTKPFDLWVADEIDTALDTAGLERLMMVLQEKAKERGTVVVISHSDLRDWISKAWTVTLKDGVSTLTT